MPRILYKSQKFKAESLALIDRANAICREYIAAGYDLTLRQLYYQFVARGLIPNNQQSYKRLGSVLNDARMAGLLDWNYLTDRTRNIEERSKWEHPRDIIEASASQFHHDYWSTQDVHVEVWVEKEALAGIVQGVTHGLDVVSLACRGYMSASEQWEAAQRFGKHIRKGQRIVLLHLGDHDPSGIDMSRDNEDRLRTFIYNDMWRELDRLGLMPGDTYGQIGKTACSVWGLDYDLPIFTLDRIALNMDQVEQYNPPPNFAKITDSRAHGDDGYIARYGDESWELDALPPNILSSLIDEKVMDYVDVDAFEERKALEIEYRNRVHRLLAEHGDLLDVDDDTPIDDND